VGDCGRRARARLRGIAGPQDVQRAALPRRGRRLLGNRLVRFVRLVRDGLHKTRQPFNVNAIAQAGALAGLQDDEHQARTREITDQGRTFLQGEFARRGLEFVPSSANFILVKVGDGQDLFQRLLRRGMIIRAMYEYKLPDWIRVSIGTPELNRQFIRDLDAVLIHRSGD
jgi:histidinol-phosphate/aromatic aminotransferase/cobyric acid decarboxylase-like protein